MKILVLDYSSETRICIRHYYLKHEEELYQIASHGMKTMRAYHSVETQANHFIRYLKNVLY